MDSTGVSIQYNMKTIQRILVYHVLQNSIFTKIKGQTTPVPFARLDLTENSIGF